MRSTLVRQRLIEAIEALAQVERRPLNLASLVAGYKRLKKRPVAELEKSVLALLNTCIAWKSESVSERKIHASDLLKQNRQQLGLDHGVSQGSVHNHLVLLAKLCGVKNILEAHSKRQASRFCGGVKKRLASIKNALVASVREQEERANRPAQDRGAK